MMRPALPSIVLQKAKVAAPRIFRENNKRETVADSYTLNRAAEVASEFDARGSVPLSSLHQRRAYSLPNY
jgi:hypothetical protein